MILGNGALMQCLNCLFFYIKKLLYIVCCLVIVIKLGYWEHFSGEPCEYFSILADVLPQFIYSGRSKKKKTHWLVESLGKWRNCGDWKSLRKAICL